MFCCFLLIAMCTCSKHHAMVMFCIFVENMLIDIHNRSSFCFLCVLQYHAICCLLSLVCTISSHYQLSQYIQKPHAIMSAFPNECRNPKPLSCFQMCVIILCHFQTFMMCAVVSCGYQILAATMLVLFIELLIA